MMKTTTFEFERLDVKQEALIDIEGEAADAEFCLDAITELGRTIDF